MTGIAGTGFENAGHSVMFENKKAGPDVAANLGVLFQEAGLRRHDEIYPDSCLRYHGNGKLKKLPPPCQGVQRQPKGLQ